jgi:hypothetical protein
MNTNLFHNTFAPLMTLALTFSLTTTAPGQGSMPTNHADSAAPRGSAAFEQTLQEFTKMAAKDQTLCALLSKHAVTFEYSVSDYGLQCHLGSNGKTVDIGLDKPAHAPEIVVQSTAATLDRFLRGQDSQSDMKVSVNLGLMRKIMLKADLQQIRSAVARIYSNASDKVTQANLVIAQN